MNNLKENLVWLEKLINDTDKHEVVNHKDGELRFYKFGGFFNSYEINCTLDENGGIKSIFHIGYNDPTGSIKYNSVKEMYQELVLGEKVGEFRANPSHYTL
jgi:hypothetical protein